MSHGISWPVTPETIVSWPYLEKPAASSCAPKRSTGLTAAPSQLGWGVCVFCVSCVCVFVFKGGGVGGRRGGPEVGGGSEGAK